MCIRDSRSNALAGKAVLVCAEAQYMDLAVGQDLAAAYLELVNLNHYFRILETAALRIKNSACLLYTSMAKKSSLPTKCWIWKKLQSPLLSSAAVLLAVKSASF